MSKFLTSHIGRLRAVAFFEGISLIVLVLIGVPMKYTFDNPLIVELVGPLHGFLFLLFLIATMIVSVEYKWSFFKTTWKVLLSSIIPFGTLYVDAKILKPIQLATQRK